MEHLTTTQSVLLDLLSRALFQKEVTFAQETDWNAVLKEAIQQAVPAVAFADFQESSDESLKTHIKNAVYSTISTHIKIEYAHCGIHKLMTEHNIPYVILKGCASAAYYPKPVNRSMGDVDFMVHPEDYQRTCELLTEQGYCRGKVTSEIELGYSKDNIRYEVHQDIHGIPKGHTGEIIAAYFTDIFSDANTVHSSGGAYLAPSQAHHGLIMLLHTAIHLQTTGFGLRHLCDWAVFVNQYTSDAFCEEYQEKLKTIGLWRYAQILTQLSTRYLGLPPQNWAEQDVDTEMLASVIQDIFQGGNFGRKDYDRSKEGMFISHRYQGAVDNSSAISQFMRSAKNNIQFLWPMTKKYPVLYPFVFIAYCIRFLFQVVTDKRRAFKLSQVIKKAEQRRDIYRKFHLFEMEKQ